MFIATRNKTGKFELIMEGDTPKKFSKDAAETELFNQVSTYGSSSVLLLQRVDFASKTTVTISDAVTS